jgi:3D (Asp-Asp-Asp) domain-containing protein
MKRFFFTTFCVWMCAMSAFGATDGLLARVTVYWARGGRGSDRYTRQHRSATGAHLQSGHCAVDPRRIPYGSRVVFPDGSALAAVDTGGAVRNRKAARLSGRNNFERSALVIDKFFETKREAVAWANRNPAFMQVRVVPPNAPLAPRPNIANSQRIVLNPQPIGTTNSASAMNGSIVHNPLGRLGR